MVGYPLWFMVLLGFVSLGTARGADWFGAFVAVLPFVIVLVCMGVAVYLLRGDRIWWAIGVAILPTILILFLQLAGFEVIRP